MDIAETGQTERQSSHPVHASVSMKGCLTTPRRVNRIAPCSQTSAQLSHMTPLEARHASPMRACGLLSGVASPSKARRENARRTVVDIALRGQTEGGPMMIWTIQTQNP